MIETYFAIHNGQMPGHYGDVIMGAIASQITSLMIVYSTFYSDADQRKHQSSASLAFCAWNSPGTGEFPAHMASYAENVSIWWRHHGQSPCAKGPWTSLARPLKGNAHLELTAWQPPDKVGRGGVDDPGSLRLLFPRLLKSDHKTMGNSQSEFIGFNTPI